MVTLTFKTSATCEQTIKREDQCCNAWFWKDLIVHYSTWSIGYGIPNQQELLLKSIFHKLTKSFGIQILVNTGWPFVLYSVHNAECWIPDLRGVFLDITTVLLIFNPARWRASIGRVDRNGAQGGVGWGHSLNLALSQNVNENSNASRCYRLVGCFPFGLDLRCRILVKNIWTHRHTWLMSGGEAAIVCLGLVEKCQSVTSSSDRKRFWQFEKISKESGNLRNEHLARKGSS